MIIKTQSIVLRAIKYGETSLIVSMLTSDQGLQSYIINGVRTEKKSAGKASHYLPGSWLQLEAYHREGKNINRIKEAFAYRLFTSNTTNPVKNAVVLFMTELMEKCVKHPEKNEPLFRFLAGKLEELDGCEKKDIMHCLLSFTLLLPDQLGLGLENPSHEIQQRESMVLDLAEGSFVKAADAGSLVLTEEQSGLVNAILAGQRKNFTDKLAIESLERFMVFYQLHFPEFGKMKTLSFLMELIS